MQTDKWIKVELSKENTLYGLSCIVGVNEISGGLRWIRPTSLAGDTTRFRTLVSACVNISY